MHGSKVIRTIGRYLALAVALVLVLPFSPWPEASVYLPAVSPWIAAASALAARAVSVLTLVGLPVLLLALWRRRWFCTHACPTGLVLEWVAKLSPLRRWRWWKKVPSLGKGIVLLTLGGAALGYPLLLWLDPLAMFPALLGLAEQVPGWPEALAGGLLAVVLVLSLVAPNLWCRRLCPLGASQDILASTVRWRPSGKVAEPPAVRPAVTVHGSEARAVPAAACEGDRPIFAASAAGRFGQSARCAAKIGTVPGERLRPALARRTVLSVGLGAVAAGLGAAAGGWIVRRPAEAAEPPLGPLRPPGASGLEQFGGLCVRCGNCIRVCPTGVLHADLGEGGVGSFLTPLLRVEGDYCREDCRACTQVCPSGAIRRLSLEDKRRTAIGLAKVDVEHCLLGWNQECSVCENRCPYEAIKITFDEVEYMTLPQVDPEKCVGCGACQVACPSSPKSIVVLPEAAPRILSVEAEEDEA